MYYKIEKPSTYTPEQYAADMLEKEQEKERMKSRSNKVFIYTAILILTCFLVVAIPLGKYFNWKWHIYVLAGVGALIIILATDIGANISEFVNQKVKDNELK